MAQPLDPPSYTKKILITNKVTTDFFVTLIGSICYTLHTRPTDLSRVTTEKPWIAEERKNLWQTVCHPNDWQVNQLEQSAERFWMLNRYSKTKLPSISRWALRVSMQIGQLVAPAKPALPPSIAITWILN